MKIKSVKQESILKQFLIYFVVASVIPFITFLYLLSQLVAAGPLNVSMGGVNLKLLVAIAGVLSVLGFIGARGFLSKIVFLSDELNTGDLDKVDKTAISEIAKGEGEVASLARVFGDITSKLERNVRELEQTKVTLHRVLSKVGKAMSSVENFDLLIQFILETIVEAVGAKRGVIYSLDEDKKTLRPRASVGLSANFAPTDIKIGEEAIGWVAKERKPLLVPSLEDKEGDTLFAPPLIAAPLIAHERLWGAISLSGKTIGTSFSEDELKILSNLASQIAISFENASLNTEVEKTYFETISALALAVEAKDHYSHGHSEKVAEYARKIAESLGLPQDALDTLTDAARLHDIGKIGIADEILKKPAKLTDDEMSIMHKHPLIGEGIVKPLRSFQHIIDPITHHHEFLDGSGYPDGLKGEQIPLITRILTVSDIFDALTSDRPYRKALSHDEAKRELKSMVDRNKIDSNIVGALFKLIDEKRI